MGNYYTLGNNSKRKRAFLIYGIWYYYIAEDAKYSINYISLKNMEEFFSWSELE